MSPMLLHHSHRCHRLGAADTIRARLLEALLHEALDSAADSLEAAE